MIFGHELDLGTALGHAPLGNALPSTHPVDPGSGR